jgi:hypothetical protein
VKGDGECCPILVATGKGVALTIAGAQNIASHHTRFVPIRGLFLPVRVFWKEENENPYLRTFVSFIIEKRSVLSQKTECLVLSNERVLNLTADFKEACHASSETGVPT